MQAVFSQTECLRYKDAYEVSVTISHPLTGKSVDLHSVIDSGFSGSVMVESNLYQELGFDLTEKPSAEFPVYKTMLGSLPLRSSYGKAKIGTKELDAEVLTPVYGTGKNLVGRKILGEFTTLLHRREKACIGDAELEE